MLSVIFSELLYVIKQDWRKLAAIILLVFVSGIVAGFCAGKVVEMSVENEIMSHVTRPLDSN